MQVVRMRGVSHERGDKLSSKSKEEERKQRIEKKKERLLDIYQNLEPNRKLLAEELINNAAFMEGTLEELKSEINKKGVKERYKNGQHQYGTRESISAKNYHTMIKNYMSIIKQLNDMLPDDVPPEDDFDAFNNF